MSEAYAASIERLRALQGSERDPDGRGAVSVAELLRRMGKLAEANAAVLEAVAIHPDYPAAHLVRARVALELDEHDEVRSALRRVRELDPGNRNVAALEQSLAAAEESAALEWARAQGRGPVVEVSDEVVTATLGELYLNQGAFSEAATVFRRLLAEGGEDPALRTRLKVAQDSMGAVPEAAVPVADLAPSQALESAGPRKQDAVPVSSLAPDAVPVSSLAPTAVPVASLAPDLPSDAGQGDGGEDDFMAWLDKR